MVFGVEEVANRGDAVPDRRLAEVAESEYELRRVIVLGQVVLGHRLDADASLAGGPGDGDLVRGRGQPGHGMESCRRAGEPHGRGVLGESIDQYVALSRVDGPHAPQVPVVSA